jgi:D-beta-D-heptose 7-phosphate kinase/D-beta-D-heptose 1-phosphate adenosyltransferase
MTLEEVGQAKDFLKSRSQLGPVAVVGDLCIDRFIFGSVDRISPEAPVPVLKVEKTFDKPGCAANVAVNLAEWKLPLTLIGVVGTDEGGTRLESLVKNPGSTCETRLLKDPSRPTTLKTRFIAGSQHQMLRVDEESTRPLSAIIEAELIVAVDQLLPRLKCLVVQDYAKGLFSEKLLSQILLKARTQGVLTLVDPNRNTPGTWYKGAGCLTPNVAEAESLLGYSLDKGQDDAFVEKSCRELKSRFSLDMVIITRSAYGMTLLDRTDKVHHFPTLARNVFDVTGAGDTVVAVLAAAIAGGLPPSVGAILATAAAGVVVGKVGTATASQQEILDELDGFTQAR